ncbi:unnamed protein product [Mycena citricolor]|uniref:Uncharacterized protein n=1 Tax=Mycena citricolor TaxID=2018698 RepID=A0AAD2Q450_9AGAR|nr:unnamed protein product [Mycena citricolor]
MRFSADWAVFKRRVVDDGGVVDHRGQVQNAACSRCRRSRGFKGRKQEFRQVEMTWVQSDIDRLSLDWRTQNIRPKGKVVAFRCHQLDGRDHNTAEKRMWRRDCLLEIPLRSLRQTCAIEQTLETARRQP